MKIFTRQTILFATLVLGVSFPLRSQDCVQCSRCTTTGNNASAIGSTNTASGNNSLAGGYSSQAIGSNSLAFGYRSKAGQSTTVALGNTAEALGTGSTAVGNYVKANAQNSFVFGAGTTANYPLTNNTPFSIAFGVNSNKPTMLITKALNNNYTGKVAIGNVTPTTKLHIKSDNNEDASVFIEPANKNDWKAYINLFDTDHIISVDHTAAMKLNSGNGTLLFQGNHYCFGGDSEIKTRIYTKDKAGIYYNANRTDGIETRDGEGSSYAIEFNNNELQFRTAVNQTPRNTEITNWRNAFSVSVDGKIGLGAPDIYLKNNSNKQLVINSPDVIDLQSSNITLSGKVGINTTNDVNGYALAVNGGIVSTKVLIKEVNYWPDYVFSDDYHLMELGDLKDYLNDKKHLPGVPSQAEVAANGYEVGAMQQILLEKIEEMARYILLLQEEIDTLKSKNGTLGFTYDDNGNRISRGLYFERMLNPAPNPTAQNTAYDLCPNPTQGQFSLILREPDKEVQLHATLLTVTGVVIDEKDINGAQAIFDLSAQPSGIYLLHVDGPEEHHSWKVIKK